MTILPQNLLQEARPLSYFVEHLPELPAWLWLYVAADTSEISQNTPCHARAVDARDMSDDDMDAFDSYVHGAGIRCFLNCDQLQEIVENAGQQQPAPTAQQIVAAIAHYWAHDSFIDLSTNAA